MFEANNGGVLQQSGLGGVKLEPYDTYVRIAVSPSSYLAMARRAEELSGIDSNYNLVEHNCLHNSLEILSAGGVYLPPLEYPESLAGLIPNQFYKYSQYIEGALYIEAGRF